MNIKTFKRYDDLDKSVENEIKKFKENGYYNKLLSDEVKVNLVKKMKSLMISNPEKLNYAASKEAASYFAMISIDNPKIKFGNYELSVLRDGDPRTLIVGKKPSFLSTIFQNKTDELKAKSLFDFVVIRNIYAEYLDDYLLDEFIDIDNLVRLQELINRKYNDLEVKIKISLLDLKLDEFFEHVEKENSVLKVIYKTEDEEKIKKFKCIFGFDDSKPFLKISCGISNHRENYSGDIYTYTECCVVEKNFHQSIKKIDDVDSLKKLLIMFRKADKEIVSFIKKIDTDVKNEKKQEKNKEIEKLKQNIDETYKTLVP